MFSVFLPDVLLGYSCWHPCCEEHLCSSCSPLHWGTQIFVVFYNAHTDALVRNRGSLTPSSSDPPVPFPLGHLPVDGSLNAMSQSYPQQPWTASSHLQIRRCQVCAVVSVCGVEQACPIRPPVWVDPISSGATMDFRVTNVAAEKKKKIRFAHWSVISLDLRGPGQRAADPNPLEPGAESFGKPGACYCTLCARKLRYGTSGEKRKVLSRHELDPVHTASTVRS